MDHPRPNKLQLLLVALVALPSLYVNVLIYQSGNFGIAIALLCLNALFVYTYLSPKAYSYRYLFPGLVGFAVFVILPLVYTFAIGFTKYESSNLLRYDRVRLDLLSQTYTPNDGLDLSFNLYEQEDSTFRLHLFPHDKSNSGYWSKPFSLESNAEGALDEAGDETVVETAAAPESFSGTRLSLREIVQGGYQVALREKAFAIPDSQPVSIYSLRRFVTQLPLWTEQEDNSLRNEQTGQVARPDSEKGFFIDEAGETIGFGYRTWAGLDNYRRIIEDERVKGPFFRIFVWTFVFALLSVVSTFALGMLLAVLLEWDELRGRKVYRTLLILPYAVPAFLSILVFQGMFNQEAGAVNEFLGSLFSIKPEWNSNPWMARSMVLIVNLWLGYPYMMLICTGVLQSIPKQIYEASSIDGSGPIHNFFKLTLPLIIPPILPLLIASFAFNFNNFNLIFLLTQGGPPMVDGGGIAGNTDILVTYTFNMAFRDSGSNFGLACAIATILFAIVGTLAWINLRLTRNQTTSMN